jgi:hypothetical protein
MMSNNSSVVASNVDNSDDDEEYKNPGHAQTAEDVGEDAVAGSVAQLQFSKFASKRPEPEATAASRRPAGLTVDTTKGKFGGQKHMSDFSPMTPGKGIAVRFNTNAKGNPADALKAPHLPPVV